MEKEFIKSNKREVFLDTISGILIIYMILYHIFLICRLTDTIYYQSINILFFFMPWFFFKSGMFFKKRELNDKIKYIWKRYLIPFIVFSIVGQFVYCIQLFQRGDYNIIHHIIFPIIGIILNGSFSGNLPLWFLTSLSVVSIMYIYICSYFKRIWLAFILIPFLINLLHINSIPIYVCNVLTGLFFYGMGHSLKTLQYNKFIFIISLIGYILIYNIMPSIVDMRTNILISGNYLLWIVSSLMGIISINNIFKRIEILNKFKLDLIGRSSMSYYVSHGIILSILSMLININDIKNSWNHFYLMLFSCIIILPIINYILHKEKIKFIIGE